MPYFIGFLGTLVGHFLWDGPYVCVKAATTSPRCGTLDGTLQNPPVALTIVDRMNKAPRTKGSRKGNFRHFTCFRTVQHTGLRSRPAFLERQYVLPLAQPLSEKSRRQF